MRRRNVRPWKHLRHAGVQPAFDHQLVRRRRLFQMREVRPLQTLLVHPHIAHVEGAVETAGAGTNHHHTALFAHQSGYRKCRLAGVFKHHIDVDAFAGDIPDRLAELARLGEPDRVFRAANRRQLPPAFEIVAVDHTFGAQTHHKFALGFVADHADCIGPGGVDQLDRIRPKSTRRAPHEHVLPGFQIMGLMAEQHPVGGGQRQGVAGCFFPRQVLWAVHQLLCLHLGELCE